MARGGPLDRRLLMALVVLLVAAGVTTVRRVHHVLAHDAQQRLVAALHVDPAPPAGEALPEVLARAGITRVAVSGHAVTVHGVARPPAETARLLAAVRGDGIASARYVVDPGAAVAGEPGGVEVTARTVDGAVRLDGRVQSDAQRTTLLTAAGFAFGAPRVRAGIDVVASGPRDAAIDEAVSAFAALFAGVAHAGSFELRLAGRSLSVRATVPDEATRALVVALVPAPGADSAFAHVDVVHVGIDARAGAADASSTGGG